MLAVNRRRSERRVCRSLAKIQFGTGTLPRDCLITDISDGGVKVVAEHLVPPPEFTLIFSTGNPNPDLDGSKRAGDNLYTDSIIALHLKDGSLAWYYQEVKHDVWDYDAVSNVVLFDTLQNGRTVPAAGEAGKNAFFYIVNRETGKLIRRSEPFDLQRNMYAPPTAAGGLV